MSIDSFLTTPVTIVNPATVTNGYGGKDLDWSTASRTAEMVWVHQTSGTEATGGRDALVSTLKIFGSADSVITGRSRVEIGDATYEVDGRPLVAATPDGAHHTESNLRIVEG